MSKDMKILIDGMTCSSCEILLERKLKKIKGVSKVNVNHSKGSAILKYSKNKPNLSQISSIIENAGYILTTQKGRKESISRKKHFMELGGVFVIVLALFLLLGSSELFSGVGVSENMSFGFVFLIGVVAAFSSCLAVTGGLLVSVTAKYSQMYPNLEGFQRFKPHLYFNVGRIIGYTILGALIGAFGSLFTISSTATGFLTILASVVMILLGLQLLDLSPEFLNVLKPKMPKFFSHKIIESSENSSKCGPFFLGGVTFFLPCGFTQALQIYVLSMGDFILGGITMFAFSLGTLPGLLSLGALSSFLKGTAKRYFFKTAGVAVLLIGIVTIQNGFVLAGLYATDIDDSDVIGFESVDPNVRIENGVQIVEMKIKNYDYFPSKFTIYKDMPVEWRIDGREAAGCAKVISMPKAGVLEYLSDEVKSIKFTPDEVGDLEFMCTMAMTTRGAKFRVIEDENIIVGAEVSGEVVNEISEVCNPEVTSCFVQKFITEVTYDGFKPNKFEVKVGVPVEVEIDAKVKLGGCMGTLVIPEFDVVHNIKYGNSTLKFTPDKEGKFSFTCSMGTYYGDFIVTK